MPIRTFELPAVDEPVSTQPRTVAGVSDAASRLQPAQLKAAIAAALRAADALHDRSVDDILAVLDRVVAAWLDPDSCWQRLALDALPALTGFSAQTIAHGLPRLLAPLRADAIRALFDAELGDYRLLDAPRGGRRVRGQRLVAHVLSGNIPGLSAAPMLLSLALKSAVLVKSAAGDPIFPALLAASISATDAALGKCVAVTYWRGGDVDLEHVAFGAADLVVASGSDAAMRAIAARTPGRFIGHGHKISFAAVARECLDDPTAATQLARALAYDVSLWDQQGCLSPQACYVEFGGGVTAMQFAELLATALDDAARALPPRRLTFDEQAAVQQFRQAAEWGGDGAVRGLASADSTAWSLSLAEGAALRPSCLNRCLRLQIVPSLDALPAALTPHRRHLECAGLAAGSQRRPALTELLGACGVHRVCPVGSMQLPTLAWRQSGRPRVAEWVEWTTTEDATSDE